MLVCRSANPLKRLDEDLHKRGNHRHGEYELGGVSERGIGDRDMIAAHHAERFKAFLAGWILMRVSCERSIFPASTPERDWNQILQGVDLSWLQ